MSGLKKIFIPVFCFVLGLLPREMSARNTDLSESLRYDVEFLSSTLCAGRASGTAGASETIWYISRRFAADSIETYPQTFSSKAGIGRNVIGEIRRPGARQWVILTAYLDGLGVRNDVTYPGADSNASGIAALLAVADSLSAAPLKKYNVALVALDGHCAELAGSVELWKRTVSRRNVRMLVNLDILGSSLAPVKPYQKQYLIALGASPWKKTFEALGKKYGLTVYYDYYGSPDFTDLFFRRLGDQSVFVQHDVPSVMFTSGITMNTNKVSDTAETLDYGQFARRVSLILNWLRDL